MTLITLVYVSVAQNRQMNNDELLRILKEARENNQKLNVTGMLLYRDGFFIQALEGEQDVVEDLYAHIAKDQRHKNIITVYQNEIKERLFTDWSMGFNRVEDKHLESIEGYNGLINEHFFADKPGRAVSLLESFRNRSYF
ncbi:MAG: BLUF domain-containing protein [Phototrophicaceae bacterium]